MDGLFACCFRLGFIFLRFYNTATLGDFFVGGFVLVGLVVLAWVWVLFGLTLFCRPRLPVFLVCLVVC